MLMSAQLSYSVNNHTLTTPIFIYEETLLICVCRLGETLVIKTVPAPLASTCQALPLNFQIRMFDVTSPLRNVSNIHKTFPSCTCSDSTQFIELSAVFLFIFTYYLVTCLFVRLKEDSMSLLTLERSSPSPQESVSLSLSWAVG